MFSFTHMVSAPHVKPTVTVLKEVAKFYSTMPFLAPTPFSRFVQHAEDRIWYASSNAQHKGICTSYADISKTEKDKAVVTTEHDYVVWDAEPIVECACLCEMSASNCARCITTYVWGQVISGHE